MIQRARPSARLVRREPRHPRQAPAWLGMALAAFVVRAAYVVATQGMHPTPWSDAADYDGLAWNLTRGLGFVLEGRGGLYATAFRPPVVPWITSLLYRGIGHDYLGALLLQCAIGALVPPLLARFAGMLFGGAVGALAGWLAVIEPVLVFFSGYLLTETTFCAALLVALLLTAAWVKTPRAGRALASGLAWGVATLTRPTALLLPVVAAAWAWVPLGLTTDARERARQLLIVVLGMVLVIAPWTLRNAVALHAFVPVTTGGGRALLDSNNPVVWNDPGARGGALSLYRVEPWASHFRGLSEPAADAYAQREAVAFLRAHVAEWPAMVAAKLARFWRLTAETASTGGAWQSPASRLRRVIDPLLVWSIVAFPFAVWGLVRTWRGPRRWFQLLPVLVILYFMALAIVYWGALRTRVPAEPLIVVFTAAGIDDVRRRLRSRARGLRLVQGRR